MMLDSIVNELMVATEILQTNNVTRIAGELGYQPLLIMNALSEGNRSGKFTYHRKHDTIDIATDAELDKLNLSEGVRDLSDQLVIFITDMNSRESDIWITRLVEFIPGTTELQVRLAIHSNDKLATYDVKDPRDKKSIYTFVTLAVNADKQYGAKQFVDPPKGKKAKKNLIHQAKENK